MMRAPRRAVGTLFLAAYLMHPGTGRTQETHPALELAAGWTGTRYVRYQEPVFLTFEELKTLAQDPHPGGAVEAKLEKFWETPVVSNEAYYAGAKPHRPEDPRLGPLLRVASWNVEKSFHIEEVVKLLTQEEAFLAMMNPKKAPRDSPLYKEMRRQREKLLQADVLILQEMDLGVKRSGYVDAARTLAKALNMNYAYAAQQLEVDPVVLGLEPILLKDGSADEEAMEYYRADPERYKGVFGSAVLSRYPIKKVLAFQMESQAYDWYWGEKYKTTFLENARRFGAKTVFKNELTREMKVGGRIFFRVDLEVPDLPGRTLTVIDIHLEIKCLPQEREIQMNEILHHIYEIKHPVVMAGDFNAAPADLSPTSVSRAAGRTAQNPTTWFSAAVHYVSPHALVINTSRFLSNVTKNFDDPTARHIPVIAPNRVRSLFQRIEIFRTEDGSAFDFRGDRNRSISGTNGTLANSNRRDFKGFKTTFSVKRPLGPIIGRYRLDWMFVKSFLKHPRDRNGPYRFAPHFGETLEELNTGLETPVSDHHPNVVDLPFEEPKL